MACSVFSWVTRMGYGFFCILRALLLNMVDLMFSIPQQCEEQINVPTQILLRFDDLLCDLCPCVCSWAAVITYQQVTCMLFVASGGTGNVFTVG